MNITKTITIDLPDNFKQDDLIECMMYLRVLSQNYPRVIDIAYAALEREYQLPPVMVGSPQA